MTASAANAEMTAPVLDGEFDCSQGVLRRLDGAAPVRRDLNGGVERFELLGDLRDDERGRRAEREYDQADGERAPARRASPSRQLVRLEVERDLAALDAEVHEREDRYSPGHEEDCGQAQDERIEHDQQRDEVAKERALFRVRDAEGQIVGEAEQDRQGAQPERGAEVMGGEDAGNRPKRDDDHRPPERLL